MSPRSQIGNLQESQCLIHALNDFIPRHTKVFKAKGNFIQHLCSKDLTFRVLQNGSDLLRNL